MSFPCAENTDSDLIFIIGRVFHTLYTQTITVYHKLYNIDLYKFPAIGAYLYNPSDNQWHNISSVPCPMNKPRLYDKYSCTYLKTQNTVLTGIENCTAAFNLSSWTWTSFDLPLENGVLFKNDMEDDIVYYIGNNTEDSSNIYTVSITIHCES